MSHSKKVYYSWHDVERQVQSIVRKLHLDRWYPDYVVGITRGGAVPATLMSHYLGVPMYPLQVCLRDNGITVSDTALAEDAAQGKNILVVDDINDSGATLDWISRDWQSVTGADKWQSIAHHSVKFATLLDNVNSDFTVDYSATTIDKVQNPVWVVFPWEDWWTK